MIKILVIEDDYIWQAKIECMLSDFKSHYSIVGAATDLETSNRLLSYTSPDIIIADVYLGNDNIFETMLPILQSYPTVVITSTHEDIDFQISQNLENCIFLIKPFLDYTLISSLKILENKCSISIKKSKFLTFIAGRGNKVKISFTNIAKFTVEGNYCICYTNDEKKYAKKISLNLLLDTLDERFIRISKTTVVNLDFVTKIDYSNKLVYLGHELHHVGRSYFYSLKDTLVI